MISDKGDYLYTDEATLARIKIDGDILPLRNQHQTLRSEDVVFLNECRCERESMADDEAEARSFPVPRLNGGLIEHNPIVSGGWHTDAVMNGSATLLTEDKSDYNGADDLALAQQIDGLISTYNKIENTASAERSESKAEAAATYQTAKENIDEWYGEAYARIESDYQRVKTEEKDRYAEFLESENGDYAEGKSEIEQQIKEIEEDETLSRKEKKELVAEKSLELEELALTHERSLYDGRYEHEQNVRDIEEAHDRSLDDIESERKSRTDEALRRRDDAYEGADETYDAALANIKAQLASACRPVVSDRISYRYAISPAFTGAGLAGIDTRTPGAIEWDRRISGSKIDVNHSAARRITEGNWRIHLGLLYWALYSDYEHMRVLRVYGSVVEDARLMRFRYGGGWGDSYKAADDISFYGNLLDPEGSGYEDGGYWAADSTVVRFYVPITNRNAVNRISNVNVELKMHVWGDESHAPHSDNYHHIDRTYSVVVRATTEDPCPNYHRDQDSINDKADEEIARLDANMKSDVANRTAQRDADIAAQERSCAEDIERYRKTRDGKIADARREAAATIDDIAKTANTAAATAERPSSIINRAILDIQSARAAMEEKIASAKSEYTQSEDARVSQRDTAIYGIKDQCRVDVFAIESECASAKSDVETERMEDLYELYLTYSHRRGNAPEKYYYAPLRQAYQDFHDNYPKRDDYDTQEEYDEAVKDYEAGYVATQSAIAAAAVPAINACEYPSDYRLCAVVDGARVFGVETGLPNNGVYRWVDCDHILIRPNLRTLTGGDFSRFDEYYQDATGPTGPTVNQTPQS